MHFKELIASTRLEWSVKEITHFIRLVSPEAPCGVEAVRKKKFEFCEGLFING